MLLQTQVLSAHLKVFANLDAYSGPPCLVLEVPRGNINRHKPGGLEKLDKHIKDWHKIRIAFKAVARESIKHNGHIAVEWPSGCDYWRYHIVQEFFAEFQLEN